ncbi:DUF2486 family protein [Burkholderia stagnalis]|uniref:DUF2486 family protein n=1 Tax=Burkholderia stagnalis TaxID=1503054 RepID=UPI000F56B46C|nr:DUF2486 family protein [Burkholderia stagnalis]RQQ47353.1 DUF2486 family protein [Burkholderia stagnalis]RQX98571.1 DUF2486 family protein [Burkholderia stagnalis]RQY12672.1 DUF2486 family protein [Burkholderia stagnalis]RQY28761.1 DUF2486 family protein [Burkholderia stagnalis]
MGQAESNSIPTLTDVLVPGNPARAHPRAGATPRDDAAIPVLTDVIAPGDPARADAAAADTRPAEVEADPETVTVEPVPTPHVPAVELPARGGADHPIAGEQEAVAAAALAASAAAHQVPAPAPAALTPEDAQRIAERLRNRLTNYLTGAGREAIEARCRDALHDHTAWLVSQITREVALALETEVMEWVRDAVDEEIARRGAGHPD